MRKFQRKRGLITTKLSNDELDLLASLIDQLVEMVSDGQPDHFAAGPDIDPFEALTRGLKIDPDEPETSDDPVMQRMFPNAYPHDAAAASDFRRFTEHDLKAKKIVEAQLVLSRIGEAGRLGGDLRIPAEEVDAWLRTLTSLRLAIATRIGITDADSADELAMLPEDDPRAFMLSVYEWLGFAQETMLSAV